MKAISRFLIPFYKRTYKPLLLTCLFMSAISIYLIWGIYQAGYVSIRVFSTQAIAITLGIAFASAVSLLDYRLMASLWKLYLPFAAILVSLTYFVGKQRYDYVDDKAWLEIPFVGLTFQPSEILKLAFIFSFALHLEKVKDSINNPKTLIPLCVHGAIPTLMIVLQGDDGSAMVFVAIFACMIIAAGLNWGYIAAALGTIAVAAPIVWFFILDDHKRGRFLTVFNPAADPTGVGWQQLTGLSAIGSGQLWGKGLLSDMHHYVPEMHNDFIFAFIGETFGFIGSCAVLCLFGVLSILILYSAHCAKDPLGKFICVGVFGMIAFQTVWVIGMCLSLLPVAGITLPLLSAGGTSVVLTWVGIGMVLSVRRYSHSSLFNDR